jgi:hypothetical protein
MAIAQQKCGFFLFRRALTAACLFGIFSCEANASDKCVDALLSSLKTTADVSECNLLVTADGRVAAISSDDGIFLQSAKDGVITYYKLNPVLESLEVKKLVREPWTAEIFGEQTFPDPKSFYFPFNITGKNEKHGREPKNIGLFCPAQTEFSVTGEHKC